jgi:hypothetical protein
MECFNTFFDQDLESFEQYSNEAWSTQEDQLLVEVVLKHGAKNWKGIAFHVPKRNGKQCRERWVSHLSPEIVDKEWTIEEDIKLVNLQAQFGNKWSQISKFFVGCPPNVVKNRFNCLKRKTSSTKINLVPTLPICVIAPIYKIQTENYKAEDTEEAKHDPEQAQKAQHNQNDQDVEETTTSIFTYPNEMLLDIFQDDFQLFQIPSFADDE